MVLTLDIILIYLTSEGNITMKCSIWTDISFSSKNSHVHVQKYMYHVILAKITEGATPYSFLMNYLDLPSFLG